jgi:hypothetical protein
VNDLNENDLSKLIQIDPNISEPDPTTFFEDIHFEVVEGNFFTEILMSNPYKIKDY